MRALASRALTAFEGPAYTHTFTQAADGVVGGLTFDWRHALPATPKLWRLAEHPPFFLGDVLNIPFWALG